ncbi:MAG TPA: hypothetical protein VFP56_07200 [Candidatus Limnocylindrales bacterium]|nr:hypothetical protein [Candidatus Limnocylindrales bacterium]
MTINPSVKPRCNIGPAEIERRRRSAIVITALAALVAVGLLVLHVPAPARLALFPFVTAAAVTWLQVVHRFCVAFAALGIQNFSNLGEEEKVDPALRAVDRRRLAQLVLEGSAIGAAVTLLFVIVPA